jgi:P-type Ca2+ transporter type 2C
MEAGLTNAAAKVLLATSGYNELPQSRRELLSIVGRGLREPMFLLVILAALLYISVGDIGEGLFLSVGALLALGLVVFQEFRSSRALQALRELAQPQVRVLRDGSEARIPARELVPGDLLLVGEGERVPADGLLIGGEMLGVDESSLTGESAPVTKRPAAPAESMTSATAPGDDNTPYLYSATLIVRGQGSVRVTHTGLRSVLGRIGTSLIAIREQPTPLQESSARTVMILGMVALGFCVIVTLAYGYFRQDWMGGAMAGIAIAVSLVPEEVPMVLAVFMALGAWRLASQQVLTRRSAVIEALGGATVLCVDKTGTLTENQMRIARFWNYTDARFTDASAAGSCLELLRIAAQASAVHPVDPMDKAIRDLLIASAPGSLPGPDGLLRTWPLRPEMPAVVSLWRGDGVTNIAAAKGAPEAICRLSKLSSSDSERVMSTVRTLASQGLRVLGVATGATAASLHDSPEQMTFTFTGLIGFLDPVRADVPAAVQDAHAAGIRIIMLTGDHPDTAMAIARAAGIVVTDRVCLGSELREASDAQLRAVVSHCNIFARMHPDQKLRIVKALQADGHVVAMTGDGINDALALEAAHIGIAMGQRGTDVAREAADLVLLDDGFASIVNGVRLGRRIFANLRRALIYIAAIHIPIAGLALLPVIFSLPPILFVTHIVLLELVIDPVCALVFENEPADAAAMRRPPRKRNESLFGARELRLALIQGGLVLTATLSLYIWLLRSHTEEQARGAAFGLLVTTILALALVNNMSASRTLFATHRRTFWIIALCIASALALIFFIPAFSTLFRMSLPAPDALLTASLVFVVTCGLIIASVQCRPRAAHA